MRKQVKAQVLGREGERWFQSILPPEWVFQRPSEDFGIDGTVAIGDERSLTAFEFGVQIKASTIWIIRDDYLIVPSIPVDVLRYWAVRLLPTLLVAYDAANRTGYYAWVPELITLTDITSSAKATTTLKVPVSQRLDTKTWLVIKGQTLQYHRRLASALATTKVIRPLLSTVHALAQAASAAGPGFSGFSTV